MSSFTVGAFLPGKNIEDNPFNLEDYRQSYFELSQEIKAVGGKMVIVRDSASYEGNGTFSHAWSIPSPGKYQLLPTTTVDVVYDKSNFPSDNTIPVFNHADLREVCTNKMTMYNRFQEFCPFTQLVQNMNEYLSALGTISTNFAVVKPVEGFEGHGVFIDTPQKLQHADVAFPALVQAFIDTSAGIPGIVESYHDLRIALFDGEILYSYVRTPPPGKLTANVSQGGSFYLVDQELLPQEVHTIVQQVDIYLAHVGPRFYSIDFGWTPDGPKIIEMNSRLGLLPNHDGEIFRVLKKKLAFAFRTLALPML